MQEERFEKKNQRHMDIYRQWGRPQGGRGEGERGEGEGEGGSSDENLAHLYSIVKSYNLV